MTVKQLNFNLVSMVDFDSFKISIISLYDQLLDCECSVNVEVQDDKVAEDVGQFIKQLSSLKIEINGEKQLEQSIDVPSGCLFFPGVLVALEKEIKNITESKMYEVARPESASEIYEIMTTTLNVPTKILGFVPADNLPSERIPYVMKMIYEKLLPTIHSVQYTMKDIFERVEKKSSSSE